MMEPQDNAEQADRITATPSGSLGAKLREAREHLGFSVEDVAAQIKFAPRQIEALEADDFKHLPEPAFLRGFVRSYAKILNLDAQPLLAALPQEKTAAPELTPASVNVPYPVDNTSQIQNLVLLGAALLLAVIAVGFSVWHFTTPLRQTTGAKLESPAPLPVQKQVVSEPLDQEQSVAAPSGPAETKRQSSAAVEEKPQSTAAVEPKRKPSPTVEEKPQSTAVAEPKRQSTVTAAQSPVRAAKTKAVATAAQSSVQPAKTRAVATAAQSSVQPAKTRAAQATPKTQADESGNINDTEGPTTMLRLVFDEESWAEITDKDGKTISSQINPRGSELNVRGHLPMSLVIGHAATTHLYKDGEPVDLTRYIHSSSEVARITLE